MKNAFLMRSHATPARAAAMQFARDLRPKRADTKSAYAMRTRERVFRQKFLAIRNIFFGYFQSPLINSAPASISFGKSSARQFAILSSNRIKHIRLPAAKFSSRHLSNARVP